jgi:hypothetical protein
LRQPLRISRQRLKSIARWSAPGKVAGAGGKIRFFMDPVYIRLRDHARQIAARRARPRFYSECGQAWACAANFFATDPIISRLRRFVAARLNDDFGHGMNHAVKVTLDAGALALIESGPTPVSSNRAVDRLRHAQCAGLLHDILRGEPNHAAAGAAFAHRLLLAFPLPRDAVEAISRAIQDHEAFKDFSASRHCETRLLGACLYDADKFRWGPDNFTDTIWNMVTFARISPVDFIRRYPRGMESLLRIRDTFRSPTGQHYGPEFIDLGIEIGWELYEVIQHEFPLQ